MVGWLVGWLVSCLIGYLFGRISKPKLCLAPNYLHSLTGVCYGAHEPMHIDCNRLLQVVVTAYLIKIGKTSTIRQS